jgi:hypothetical protein
MHGSFKQEQEEERSGMDWMDAALLLLPIVCAMVAFIIGTNLFNA